MLQLDGAARYRHFIKRVADERKVWGLFQEGWALCGDSAGRQAFALWPAREYAEACAVGEWAGYEAREIPLAALLEELAPSLAEDGVMTSVFSTPTAGGVIVQADLLSRELLAYAEEWFGGEYR